MIRKKRAFYESLMGRASLVQSPARTNGFTLQIRSVSYAARASSLARNENVREVPVNSLHRDRRLIYRRR